MDWRQACFAPCIRSQVSWPPPMKTELSTPLCSGTYWWTGYRPFVEASKVKCIYHRYKWLLCEYGKKICQEENTTTLKKRCKWKLSLFLQPTQSVRDFGKFDWLLREKTNATTLAMILYSNNKTSEWLRSKTGDEKKSIFEAARKVAPSHRELFKQIERNSSIPKTSTTN